MSRSLMQRVFLTAAVAGFTISSASFAQTSAPSGKTEAVAADYGKLPISFEANHGQTDPSVRFMARGLGYSLFLTNEEAVLALHAPSAQKNGGVEDVVRMQLRGADLRSQSTGVDRLPGDANYFSGHDSSKWLTHVPTYSKVEFSHVYPGVDLVYYGNQSQLEFDFIVAPHADADAIRLDFKGASKLALTADGDLAVSTGHGEVSFHKPVVYQELNGERKPVAASFAMLADHSIGFKVGAYDATHPLVIDPVLGYSTYLGGSQISGATAVAVDSDGNAYVASETQDDDLPTTAGAFSAGPFTGNGDGTFVSKLNATGTALLYSAFLSGETTAYGIAVDASGSVYVTGFTGSAKFPTTPGAFQSSLPWEGYNDMAFVTKFSPDGSSLVYSTLLGGTNKNVNTEAKAIAIDGAGNAYVGGSTEDSTYPTTPGAVQSSIGSNFSAAFVTKLNAAGSSLVYSTFLGASSSSEVFSIATDSEGDAYVGGSVFYPPNYPTTPGAIQTTGEVNATPGFVAKLNPTATKYLYSTLLGGARASVVNAIALDNSGDAYVVGNTQSTDFPVTANANQPTSLGTSNGSFLSELNASGTEFLYSSYLPRMNTAVGIGFDSSSNIYVAGSTIRTSSYNIFPATSGAFETTSDAVGTGAIVVFDPTATQLLYATFFGGQTSPFNLGDEDVISGMAVTSGGSVYIAGNTNATDFPLTPGAIQTTNQAVLNYNQWGTGFVAKLNLTPTPTPDFSPAPGKYVGTVSVQLQDTAAGATIYYTLDGTTPTASSTKYTQPIVLDSGYTTIKALAAGPDNRLGTLAQLAEGSYSIIKQTTAPAFSLASGPYPAGTKLTITDAVSPSTIRYTTDGSTPTTTSKLYSGPITLVGTETIRAIAISTGDASSEVTSASYSVQ